MNFRGVTNFDEHVKKFMSNFHKDREYIVYGAGNNMQCLLASLKGLIQIKYIVDDNKKLQGSVIGGVLVRAPDALLEENKDDVRVVITPYCGMHTEIIEQLDSMGVSQEHHCHSYDLSTLWNYYYNSQVVLPEVALLITTACPLNCKGCIVYKHYHVDTGDSPYEEVVKDIDCMFSASDYVYHICLAGGEPFLHRQLEDIIDYLHTHYEGRYSQIRMNTSATVIPKPSVFKMLKKAKCYVSISNYGKECLKYQKIDRFLELLRENEVEYRSQARFGLGLDDFGLWSDFGDPMIDRNRGEKDKINLFTHCSDNSKWIHQQRLFGCPNITGAVAGKIYAPEESDYIDLSKDVDKKSVIKMFLGYNDRGYVSFCDRCDGYGEKVNPNYIAAGEQVKSGK